MSAEAWPDLTIWAMPSEMAHFIVETLQLDARSAAFDPELRETLQKVVDQLANESEITYGVYRLLTTYASQGCGVDEEVHGLCKALGYDPTRTEPVDGTR